MKVSSLVVCLSIATLGLFAQNRVPISTIIKYQDGSVFQGQVIGEDPSIITFLATTGDTITIRKIFVKRRWVAKKDIVLREMGKFHYKQGFFASFNIGQSISNHSTTQLNFLFGQRLNERYSVGLGVGFHFNELNSNGLWRNNNFAAVHLYGRKYLSTNNSGAFISSKIGYGFPMNDEFGFEDFSGGFYAEPGVGLHFASRKKIRYVFSLSQYVQYTQGNDRFTDSFANLVSLEYTTWFFRPILKFGIEFR